jgi:RNA polymerase sigma-70 factor (ECF subfamily)
MYYMIKSIPFICLPVGEYTRGMNEMHSELDSLRALDAQAISEVHNRYYPAIYRFLRYRLSDELAAEDLSAEVFVRLLEALHAGRGPERNLRGWLMGTAAHMANDHYRKHYARPMVELSDGLEADHTHDPLSVTEGREHQRLVQANLEKLTEEQQQVLALRFGSGYSLEETAEVMGKKANAIKALQFRALDALRRGLGEAAQ